MAVYSYYRTSELEATSDNDELDTILQTELLAIHTYCLANNLLVSESIADLDSSWGFELKAREKGLDLLNRLRFGDKIICSKLDRIVSSSDEALALVQTLRGKNVELHVLEFGGDIVRKNSSINFELAARVFSSLDKRKSTERIKAVKQQQRIQGRYLGGSRPFGYMIHENGRLIENPMEQRLLRKIIDLKRQGKSLRAISNQISTPVLPISFKTVQRLLQRHS
tara:strand:- start:485 stop:1156 length:672 start_codon:yes stop_codon:yes gene_type:complete